MSVVYLGLGANLGDRESNIRQACEDLEKSGVTITKMSSLLETEPEGGPQQGPYLNCVLKATTDLSPTGLLGLIHEIENQMGRIRTVTNGPRPIDIDILLYDKQKILSPQLTIPHPRMFQRDFVMRPLLEINPTLTEDRVHADYL